MPNPLVAGSITVFGTDNKPAFEIYKDGGGEWHYENYRKPEEKVEVTWRSAKRLQEFMTFHGPAEHKDG